MANTINNLKDAPGVIAKLAAGMLADKVQFCKSIDKAETSDFDGKNGYNSGDTIQISKPARFVPTTGADVTSSIQDVVEEKVSLQLDTRSVVPIELTSAEIAHDMALKSWAKRVLEPAVSSIAQDVESRFLAKAVDATYNIVGTAGSTTFDTSTVISANQKIDENVCPDLDNRFLLLNPAANTSAVNARKGLFQSSEEISKQYKSGAMGIADGFTFLKNNLLPTHTLGNDVTGVAVDDGSVTEGSSTLHVDGLTTTTGTVTKGSVFTIAGIFMVHPITKETTSTLQQFVVTADVTADGSGDADLAISPSLYAASGGLQNISALPSDNDALTFVGSASTGYVQNLGFYKGAFRMASVPLVKPDGTDLAAQETVDGMTIRVIRDYDVLTDKLIMRLDFLGGLAATRPEWASRITA